MKAPLPADEDARLQELYNYGILDTSSEAAYDDLTRLASHICGTPIALISLVDADRQWFKSRVGLDAEETPRDVAFCAHAILTPEVMVVPDATADNRFADNPLVKSDPNIRFYAGSPLVTPQGRAVGTLCVIDRQPHDLTPDQVEALQTLGRQVVAHLELRRALADLTKEQEKSERLLLRILPKTVAVRLKQGPAPIADSHQNVTVLVAEVVDFSHLTVDMSPMEQIGVLNHLFCRFDTLADEMHLQKIKTIGESYWVIGGAPQDLHEHTRAVAEFAIRMQRVALELHQGQVGPFSLRIGISTGPAVAGVIGTGVLGYDIWGQTVRAARAMQTSAPPGCIQVTEEVRQRLGAEFLLDNRGLYYVQDLGEVSCYLLKGRVERT